MDLAGALGLEERELVAFVGAGGKKTAMGRLVGEGETGDRTVGYTTTTHVPPPDLPLVLASPPDLRGRLEDRSEPVAFAAEQVENPARAAEKLRGYDPVLVDDLFDREVFDWLLVKADGARRRDFKAPAEHEPSIPERSTVVVVAASVRAVGAPLEESVVHRPERVTALTDLGAGQEITPRAMGTVLASQDGGLKGVPAGSEVILLLNKADSSAQRETADEVVREAFDRSDRFSRGLVTSFREDICLSVERGD